MRSYAKVNLGLQLLRKREDGYHDIATVFQQINFFDDLYLKKTSSSINVKCSDPAIPLDSRNLTVKAFEIFRERAGISDGVEIYIQKRIPPDSGLGGGSSNAATTLIMANRLWKTRLSQRQLLDMAQEIGSDVPFFILGGTVLGEGRGEKLTPFRLPRRFWIVLLCPRIRVSTPWAYREAKIALTNEEKMTKFRAIFSDFNSQTLQDCLKNDLEDSVFQRHPILREMKELLYKRDAFYASMSGSGSSLYGLFNGRVAAQKARDSFQSQKEVDVVLCQPIRKDNRSRV